MIETNKQSKIEYIDQKQNKKLSIKLKKKKKNYFCYFHGFR